MPRVCRMRRAKSTHTAPMMTGMMMLVDDEDDDADAELEALELEHCDCDVIVVAVDEQLEMLEQLDVLEHHQ